MTWERLKAHLDSIARIDADSLYAEFQRETGSQDLARFLAFLRERSHISAALFTRIVADVDIEVTRVPLGAAAPPEGAGAADAPPVPAPAGGRYDLLGVLDRGAMGEVLIGRDVALRRMVAFKRMLPDVAECAPLAGRFFDEVQITAQLDHPNIVPIYGVEPGPDGRIAYVMKLVHGRTLADLLEEAQQQRLTRRGEAERLREHLDHFIKVCDAVAFAHRRGVIHRDLKPENIMIGRHHEVYVMDWGICRVIGGPETHSGTLPLTPDDMLEGQRRTLHGAVMGTPAYLSPEQARGESNELTGQSDQYTLGLILQEIVTLRRANTAESTAALVFRALEGIRGAPVHVDARIRVPRELIAIIDRATALDPAARYPSVDDLADDVRRFLAGDAVLARPDTPLQALLRFIGRHRAGVLLVMMALLLTGAGATIFVLVRARGQILAAHTHEQRLQALLSQVALQGHAIDSRFFLFERELERLAGQAVEALARPALAPVETPPRRARRLRAQSGAPPAPIFFGDDFDDPARRPADAVFSPLSTTPQSIDRPSFHLPAGVHPSAVASHLQALAHLAPAFRAMMLRSAGQHPELLSLARARELLLFQGTPMRTAFITLANGVHCAFPGTGGFPPDYDGRRRPKYLLAEGKHGLHWGRPYPDRYGKGVLIAAAVPLYDAEGRFIGAAGFDMTFDFIIEHLLVLDGAQAVEETFLVDGQGRVVIRATQRRPLKEGQPFGDARDDSTARAEGDREMALRPLPFPEALPGLRAGGAGHVEIGRPGKVVAWFPLRSLGWHYVAVAHGPFLFRQIPRERLRLRAENEGHLLNRRAVDGARRRGSAVQGPISAGAPALS